MIYYLNFGFIIEQALVDIVKRYIDRQRFDDVYGNFHISVVNEHPFAHLIIDDHARAGDSFPAIVISTQNDSKTGELTNVPPQTTGVGFTSEDLENYKNIIYRNKTKVNEKGEIVPVEKKGEIVKEKIPGFLFVYDDQRIEALKEVADSRTVIDEETGEEKKGMVYGIKVVTRRTDKISVEIWSENNQLKNELYEHLRLMFTSSLNHILSDVYEVFHPVVLDKTVNGERSSNYNFDFDILLNGSHLTFDIDYDLTQIILDTEIEEVKDKDLIVEVINHVKEC